LAIGTTNNITVQDGLAHYSVQSIVQDKYGFMWFGTLNGLTRFDGYNLKNYQVNPSDTNSISNNRIQWIYLDTNKNLWISTLDSLICRYNYSDDNFSRFNRSEITKEIIDSTSRIVNRSRQYATGAGKEFFIHENRYLLIRDKNTGNQIDLDELLPERIEKRDFNCVFVDRTNVLWIGTNYYGVLRIDLMANAFKMVHVTGYDGEKHGIYSIFKDGAKLWLGTQEHGLWVYDFSSGEKKHFQASQSTENHIASNRVRSFYKDFLGRMWIGYNSGVDVFDPKTKKLIPLSVQGNITRYDINYWRNTQIIPNRNFLSITGDKSNTVWLGTDKGIFHFNALTHRMGYIDLSEYTNNTIISRIFFDSKDNAWIGTEGGGLIFLKKDSTVDSYKVSNHFHFRHGNINSLPDDRVYSIVEDSKGHIWVGTENGLCRVDTADGSILIFNESNGLADPGISCLLSDKYGQLWMSHKKGISKLDINSLSIKNYNIPELESGLHFIPRSGYYDEKEDQLYFGHTEGYIHFSPIDIQNNPFEAIPLLVNLKIDNQDIGVKQQINRRIILEQPFYSSSDITLTHKERSISIEFTAIHFANPQLNRFEYKLEGFDMDWIPTSAQNRTATYSNLKPGKYIIQSKGCQCRLSLELQRCKLIYNGKSALVGYLAGYSYLFCHLGIIVSPLYFGFIGKAESSLFASC
jgi:ligand-binding sensor domain-containing protein